MGVSLFEDRETKKKAYIFLGVDSPFFSTIVLFKTLHFPLHFLRFSRKKDPWKEWKWKVPLDFLEAPPPKKKGDEPPNAAGALDHQPGRVARAGCNRHLAPRIQNLRKGGLQPLARSDKPKARVEIRLTPIQINPPDW